MPDDEIEFGTEHAPRLLGQACALLPKGTDLGAFEDLIERNALALAWDALEAAAFPSAPPGFWPYMAQAARELHENARMKRAMLAITLEAIGAD